MSSEYYNSLEEYYNSFSPVREEGKFTPIQDDPVFRVYEEFSYLYDRKYIRVSRGETEMSFIPDGEQNKSISGGLKMSEEIILNLTQHLATPEQKQVGVVDLPDNMRKKVMEFLTFEAAPTTDSMEARAEAIVEICCNEAYNLFVNKYGVSPCGSDSVCHCITCLSTIPERGLGNKVMIGGAPYFMSTVEKCLHNEGFEYTYSFSLRKSVEKVVGGKVIKVNEFKHIDFVPKWEK